MTLEVETGAGSATAESYASAADATAYLTARGFSLWETMSETEQEAALRRATDYMTSFYGTRWQGYRVGEVQSLDWPRYEVPRRDLPFCSYYDTDVVPVNVKNACIVLAFKAASGDLAEDLSAPVIEETVGPLTVKYAQGSRQWTLYRSVDAMLAPLLSGSSSSVKVVRA